MENQQVTLDDKMNMLADTRAKLKVLLDQEKELKQVQNALEAEIAADMERQGLTQTGNDVCTISLKTETVPTVEDWDVLHQHISDTGRFELLQKRMSATAYRELIAMEPSVPGVRSTELTKVNYRSK
jgi:hypothetical protein|tara:strand:+ start:400 stop:780 length:381 start_codon:yes stop_codon:yes gene_type:complete